MSASELAENVYECDVCGYRYDPARHDDVDLDDQPEWECPDCQAERDHFQIFVPPSDDLAEADDQDGADEHNEPKLSPDVRAIYRERSEPDVSSLKRRYDKGRLNPQPDFQRYQVWSKKKNSRLIESMLLDLPLPMLYFAQQESGPTVVIDGQQRLMAIFDYLDGRYALTGLGPFRDDLEGKKFADLPEDLQERIEDFKLTIVEILKESEETIKFDLFERLNTGAVSLNEQELRNSVYRGDYNDLLKRLAANETLRKMLNLKKAHPRMADVEFVLRFMAFRDQTYLKHDDKNTGRFLNRTMEKEKLAYDTDPAKAKKAARKAEADFKLALANVKTVFGEGKAFRRFSAGDPKNPKGGWEKKINRALMDVELYTFSKYERGVVTKNRDAIYDLAVELMGENTEFADLIRHTISEKKRVIARFRIWEDALDQLLAEEDLGPRRYTADTRERLYEQDPKCAICGQRIVDIDDAHVDHVTPYVKGGATVDENAALTHRFCNMSKGANTE
jgi:rubredoxin